MTTKVGKNLKNVYDSLTEAKDDNNLRVGEHVKTLGYHTPNDGGGAEYLVVSGGTGTDDGGAYHDVNDDLQLELIEEEYVNVKVFGAKGDGVVDDTIAIQNAIKSITRGDVYFPQPEVEYVLTGSLEVPVFVNLIGSGSLTKVRFKAGTYINNIGILVNSPDGVTWVQPFPNFNAGRISNFNFLTDIPDQIRCIVTAASTKFIDLKFNDNFIQSIQSTADYIDQIWIERVFVIRAGGVIGSEYQIELKNLGDSNVITQLHTPNVANLPETPQKALKIAGCRFKMDTSLLGDVELVNVLGSSSIENCSMDGGKYIIDRSHICIRDTGGSCLENEEFIQLVNAGLNNYKVKLENITISHDLKRRAYDPYIYDIKLANNFQVDMSNIQRNIIAPSVSTEARQQFGVRLSDELGNPFEAFNSYSNYYSVDCFISNQLIVQTNVDLPLPKTPSNFFDSASTISYDTWVDSSGTYYYRIQPVWDLERLVSRTDIGGERSVALTNEGDAALLAFSFSPFPSTMFIRLYRGTSSGVYDKYVDIPLCSISILVDNGDYISSFPWQERTPSGMDTMNALNLSGIKLGTGLTQLKATAQPTAGSWKEGDVVENTSLSIDANGSILTGWLRLTTGDTHVDGTDWAKMYVSNTSP